MSSSLNLKYRLIIMSFLQFFVWGSWLITVANYWFQTQNWEADKFGAIFSTMGIASLFMPALAGIIADKWIDSEKLYSALHLLSGISLFWLASVDNPDTFFYVILVAMIFYMPTIALSNSVAYSSLKKYDMDVVSNFPPIRVFGTIGFIAAMWIVNLTGNKSSENQFYIAAVASIILALYSLTLPKCPPLAREKGDTSLSKAFGFEAFKLFKNKQMAIFLIFSMFLGAALQLTNAYGDVFLDDFKKIPEFANSQIVRYSTIIMSISQISETLFILAIPFFLKRFGIKNVMLISMAAWVLRFGLFAYGDPGAHVWMIILSCIVYGMAFDFFNISGSLYVETTTTPAIRSAAQGLFMMMTNGIGAILGSSISGLLIQYYFTHADGSKDWHGIWLSFAIYALVILIAFSFAFKHKHNPEAIKETHH
ncbi:nucleoside permease [Dysgonomonas sp. HDW5A]|uniref:nucleoside permease n=1 Tax=Dysgonomonas sp. HDW5A TaxID=2714926 RepID=UPI001409C6B7|nr:nucleoside permease [Dysgonomonas sp. HDW5A]QIK58509.1 nucleoside permease [Dysgonomonas sp. HDW5A]